MQVLQARLQRWRSLRWSMVGLERGLRRGVDRSPHGAGRAGVEGRGVGRSASKQQHCAVEGKGGREPAQRIRREAGLEEEMLHELLQNQTPSKAKAPKGKGKGKGKGGGRGGEEGGGLLAAVACCCSMSRSTTVEGIWTGS